MQTPNVEYLHGPDQQPSVVVVKQDPYIKASITWSNPDSTLSTDSFVLQDIDVTFPQGKLTLIAGKFGSGKTLMLLSLLGEANLLHGSISYLCSPIFDEEDYCDWGILNGTAYAPQVPWLQSMSIRSVSQITNRTC